MALTAFVAGGVVGRAWFSTLDLAAFTRYVGHVPRR